jgi:hypothetical protein
MKLSVSLFETAVTRVHEAFELCQYIVVDKVDILCRKYCYIWILVPAC